MALINSVSKSTLSPKSTKAFDGQVSKLQKDFAKASDLDLAKQPKEYKDNLPK